MICRGLETSEVRASYRKICEVALMPLLLLPYWFSPLTEKPVLPPVHLFLVWLNRGVFQHLHPTPVSGRYAPLTLDPNIGRQPCPGSGSQGPSVSPAMIVSVFSVQVTLSNLLPPVGLRFDLSMPNHSCLGGLTDDGRDPCPVADPVECYLLSLNSR
ncbi:uncharacterized protein BDW47DRAFT_110552 [Aspergillus candidus]|uniref:Uncharacterized protein n=1 Tax=Aspergillus candidus TaxID=41067 RepID=A0A2I2F455_ASPCN|nr:hypothetical protein BDW47DRAFT_110552 [Aspergillus candidus]PLB35414.1 hypothetical protein BDW47DRAFT_110552 [Aspergillus candidus]